MKFTISVTDDTGTESVVTTKAADLIRLERQFGLSVGEIFSSARPHLEHVWFLAWTALKRDNSDLADFESWMDTVDDVEVNDEAVPDLPLGS